MIGTKYTSLAKNTFIFSVSTFGSKFISFFLIPLYTYVLTTTEYGNVDLLNTTVLLVLPILTFNIQDAVLRFGLDVNYRKEDIINTTIKLLFISNIFLLLLVFILNKVDILKLSKDYYLFLLASFFVASLQNTLTMYLKTDDKMKVIAIAGIINTLITCGLNLFLLLYVKLGVDGYMIAYVLGILSADVYMILKSDVIRTCTKGIFDKALLKAMVAYSTPLIANGVAWWVNNASDRYILTYFCGTAVNGIYAVSYKIPSILSMVQVTFNNAWSVSAITEFDREDKDGFMGNMFTLYSLVCIFSCSVLSMLNFFLARILYSNEFFLAWQCVPLLLAGTFFNGMGIFLGCLFAPINRTKEVSYTTIVGATINIILNFILIPKVGAIGASFATLVGYMVVFVARMIMVRKIVKFKINWSVLIISIVLLISQVSIATVFNNVIYQLPIILFLFLVNKNNIMPAIDMIFSKFKK